MSSTTVDPPRPLEGDADVAPWDAPAPPPRPAVRVPRLLRGPDDDPAWARPALWALLVVTAGLYLWRLGDSGWANSFYSAAVQAGTKSWKAMLFGSSDASNFITVDKTPASLWVMEIPARIFGVNAWSVLVPQALEGVATVALLYAAVKRWFGPAAGLIAGATLALTPIAALMFRFNNPDSLLVLLLVAGAYAMTRAVEDGRTRWLVLAGTCVGFAFLAKELQAFLVLPAFGLMYLLAGPPKLGRRILQLVALTAALVVSAGWWIAVVQLWPKSSRPYIGGSQNNSFWNVLFGYNGFGRLTGSESGSVGGGFNQAGRWGPTGIGRMFNSEFGGQVSWLLPAALILLVAGLAVTLTRRRTDRSRAALVLWGGWLVLTALVFSLSKGIIHPYYTVVLGPAIGAVVGIGAVTMWRRRDVLARIVLAVTVIATAWWASVLLNRTPSYYSGLASVVLIGGFVAAVLFIAWPYLHARVAIAAGIGALVIGLAAPAAYTLTTVNTPHSGALPVAGPASQGRFGPGGFGARRFGGANNPFRNFGNGNGTNNGFPNFGNGNGTNNRFPNFGNGNGTNNGFRGFGGNRAGLGGLLDGTSVNSAMTSLLKNGAKGYRWVAASVGANNAASYQLASGEPIMSIGGFNGTDPAPTLAQFEQYVRDGKIHYFIGGGGFGGGGFGGGTNRTSSEIQSWVSSNFTSRTVGGVTVYDLSSPTSTSAT